MSYSRWGTSYILFYNFEGFKIFLCSYFLLAVVLDGRARDLFAIKCFPSCTEQNLHLSLRLEAIIWGWAEAWAPAPWICTPETELEFEVNLLVLPTSDPKMFPHNTCIQRPFHLSEFSWILVKLCLPSFVVVQTLPPFWFCIIIVHLSGVKSMTPRSFSHISCAILFLFLFFLNSADCPLPSPWKVIINFVLVLSMSCVEGLKWHLVDLLSLLKLHLSLFAGWDVELG